MASLFTNILNETRSQVTLKQRDAANWLKSRYGSINVNPSVVIKDAERPTTNIRDGIGNMYLFGYKPKHAKDLKYYDLFPLIFPFKIVSDGFYGINLHYLPYMLRARLMDSLHDLTNNKKYDDTTKLRISYDILNASSKFKLFEPCVKRYLFSHVASKFMYISPKEWDTALFVPLERFQKASKTAVWNDSLKKIGS